MMQLNKIEIIKEDVSEIKEIRRDKEDYTNKGIKSDAVRNR